MRAPLHPQIAEDLAWLKRHAQSVDRRFDAIDDRFKVVFQRFGAVDDRFKATFQRFDAIDDRSGAVNDRFTAVQDTLAGLATKADVAALRSEMYRMFWLQGGALATLILGLAGMIVGFMVYLLPG